MKENNVKHGTPRRMATVLVFCLCLVALPRASAQIPFTNSATLTLTLSGSNLLLRADFDTTNGAFTIVQGERPEALRLPACSCQISNQILDIGWVPPARAAQWTLTNWSATPARFFRLELEPFLSRGRALVFEGEPIDWAATRAANPGTNLLLNVVYKPQREVWLQHLGTYDTNGVLIGSNEGKLTGFYGRTYVSTEPPQDTDPTQDFTGEVPRLFSPSNDFRINYTGAANGMLQQSILWASEVQTYYAVDDFRCRFFNDAFVRELNLPPELATNVMVRQFRPDINLQLPFPVTFVPQRAVLGTQISYDFSLFASIYPWSSYVGGYVLTREGNGALYPPLSHNFDTVFLGDYAGLMAFWIIGANTGFPPDSDLQRGDWTPRILAGLNDAISHWVEYRYRGDSVQGRYDEFMWRLSGSWPCGGTNVWEIACDRGENIRNVMMHDEQDLSGDNVFPFFSAPRPPNGGPPGPLGTDRSALYFDAIFFDIAHEAGLGIHKADLLFWKMLSLITDTNSVNQFTMRNFGAKVMEAAVALWPDGRYTNDLADVLTSRGVPLFGVPNFRTNLPLAANAFSEPGGTTLREFASAHPSGHPGPSAYGAYTRFIYRYEETNTAAAYTAFQFYKHSKFGPCDRLAFTDGSFTTNNTGLFEWYYNNDGSYYEELMDRDMGNVVVLLPGRTNWWMSSRQRCPNEATGYYVEDVKPFGFRVIKAVSNGFSFTVQRLGETETNIQYRLSIVDPSLTFLGAAAYTWNITNHLGCATQLSGTNVTLTVQRDEPFTLSITRTRGATTDTLTWRERGNDLDRKSGQAFVRNLVP